MEKKQQAPMKLQTENGYGVSAVNVTLSINAIFALDRLATRLKEIEHNAPEPMKGDIRSAINFLNKIATPIIITAETEDALFSSHPLNEDSTTAEPAKY